MDDGMGDGMDDDGTDDDGRDNFTDGDVVDGNGGGLQGDGMDNDVMVGRTQSLRETCGLDPSKSAMDCYSKVLDRIFEQTNQPTLL